VPFPDGADTACPNKRSRSLLGHAQTVANASCAGKVAAVLEAEAAAEDAAGDFIRHGSDNSTVSETRENSADARSIINRTDGAFAEALACGVTSAFAAAACSCLSHTVDLTLPNETSVLDTLHICSPGISTNVRFCHEREMLQQRRCASALLGRSQLQTCSAAQKLTAGFPYDGVVKLRLAKQETAMPTEAVMLVGANPGEWRALCCDRAITRVRNHTC